jgi:hypothetical protein
MRVFISWSGERSRSIADILRGWLPGVLQAVKPYFSPDDIAKGARWSTEIAKELEASRIGLLVLTSENLDAPWLMFEAGALAKNLERSKVCPMLFGLEPTDITGPLVQFQAAKFEKAEVERIVKMINAEIGDAALAVPVLDSVFEMWWPKLHADVHAELSRKITTDGGARSERDLLEEVLGLTRSLARDPRFRSAPLNPEALNDLAVSYAALLRAVSLSPCEDGIVTAVEGLKKPMRYFARRAPMRSSEAVKELQDAGILPPPDIAGSKSDTDS